MHQAQDVRFEDDRARRVAAPAAARLRGRVRRREAGVKPQSQGLDLLLQAAVVPRAFAVPPRPSVVASAGVVAARIARTAQATVASSVCGSFCGLARLPRARLVRFFILLGRLLFFSKSNSPLAIGATADTPQFGRGLLDGRLPQVQSSPVVDFKSTQQAPRRADMLQSMRSSQSMPSLTTPPTFAFLHGLVEGIMLTSAPTRDASRTCRPSRAARSARCSRRELLSPHTRDLRATYPCPRGLHSQQLAATMSGCIRTTAQRSTFAAQFPNEPQRARTAQGQLRAVGV